MTITDYRSSWPNFWRDPVSPRKRWEMQQHYKGCPWGLIEEPADARAEREAREFRVGSYRARGVTAPAAEPARAEPAAKPSALTPEAIEAIVNKRVVDKALAEFGNNPETHRSLESAGLEVGKPADALKREAVATEEGGHGIMGDSLGLTAHDLFVNRVGSGQYMPADWEKLIVLNDTRESVKRVVSLYAAGHVAQRIKYGRVICQSTGDLEQIRKYLLLVSAPDELLAEGEAFAEATLRERWAEVERVAVQLQLYGKLDAKRFYELIESRVGQPMQVRRATMPLLIRSASTRSTSFNPTANTIDVIWTTGAAVRRTDSYGEPFDEVLATGPSNVRLARLNNGAPFLNSHASGTLDNVLGVVVKGSARMENGQGLATIRLSSRKEVAGAVLDLADGIVTGVSCGYRYHKVERTEGDGVPQWRVVDWEPLEISACAIQADSGAQVRDGEAFECEVRG